MIRKLLPVLLAVIGLGIGLGAGYFLRPGAAPAEAAAAAPATDPSAPKPAAADPAAADAAAAGDAAPEYAKMTNQFVVPLINGGKVTSMIILSLSIEVKAGETADAYTKEPKLRDAFLQVMFDHANAGGFDGPFTDSANMIALRKALLEAAQQILGEKALDVLITDIVRQDT
jgi:hypothetical protein